MPAEKKLIEGVVAKPLRSICDERGRLMEILRSDWDLFDRFGQCYMTTAYPGAVKAWHYHKLQTDHMTCLVGMMKFVLYDSRDDSPTKGMINEFFGGVHNPMLLKIPPLVYHGFKCISETEALVVNVPTELFKYDAPDEFRIDPHSTEIPYDWNRKDG